MKKHWVLKVYKYPSSLILEQVNSEEWVLFWLPEFPQWDSAPFTHSNNLHKPPLGDASLLSLTSPLP